MQNRVKHFSPPPLQTVSPSASLHPFPFHNKLKLSSASTYVLCMKASQEHVQVKNKKIEEYTLVVEIVKFPGDRLSPTFTYTTPRLH